MQKFITMGEGYHEIFELQALIDYNHERVQHAIFLNNDKTPATFLLVMKPVEQNLQAIYTIYNGIAYNDGQGKKYQLIKSWCEEKNLSIVEFSTKSPEEFYEREQFYQYLTGILRLNHLILPMT